MNYYEVIHFPDFPEYKEEFDPIVKLIKSKKYQEVLDYLCNYETGETPDYLISDISPIVDDTKFYKSGEYILYWQIDFRYLGLSRELEE